MANGFETRNTKSRTGYFTRRASLASRTEVDEPPQPGLGTTLHKTETKGRLTPSPLSMGEDFIRRTVFATVVTGKEPAPHPEITDMIKESRALDGCTNKNKLEAGDKEHSAQMETELNALIGKHFDVKGSLIGRYDTNPDEPDHHFGYTYYCFLGQSGVQIHTYPEHGTVDIDINVCMDEHKINDLFEALSAFFGAKSFRVTVPRTKAPLQAPEKK